jgi:hypothetical protein
MPAISLEATSRRLQRGTVQKWSNASGHYAPVSHFAEAAGLPMDKFERVTGGFPERGPQLPVYQPDEERILIPRGRGGDVERLGSPKREAVPQKTIVSGGFTAKGAPEPKGGSTPETPAARTEAPSSSTGEATRNEPTARVGMPDFEPIHVGGPSARGEAIGGAVMIVAQLKDWIMEQLGDDEQSERVNDMWRRRYYYIQSAQRDHPELDALVTIF